MCNKCREKAQWRFKYNKYKPLKNPGSCRDCNQKSIFKAYRYLHVQWCLYECLFVNKHTLSLPKERCCIKYTFLLRYNSIYLERYVMDVQPRGKSARLAARISFRLISSIQVSHGHGINTFIFHVFMLMHVYMYICV